MPDLWQPWLGNWTVSERGGPQATLNVEYHDDRGLTGTWGTTPLANVWLMWMNDFGRSVLSADLPSAEGPVSVVLCMQENFWSQIWGAVQRGAGAHGLLTGCRPPASS